MHGITIDIESPIIQRILRYVDEDRGTDHIPQPIFVVGSWGAGKSSLLRSLATRLENTDNTGKIQIFDGKQFFSSRDIIRAIEGEDYDGCTLSCGSSERRMVMIDDLDYFFNRCSFDDQYQLRNYLNNESAPLLIATISEVGDSLADYKAPFFEGVRLIYIPPLDRTMVETMNLSSEIQKRLNILLEYLPPVMRSLKMALDILAVSENEDTDLKELLDRVSQSYRLKLESIPVNSQKILYSLAGSDKPLTLSDMRGRTGLAAGILSTYLRQLVMSGEIRKTASEKKGTPYEMRDHLFKLWLSTKMV